MTIQNLTMVIHSTGIKIFYFAFLTVLISSCKPKQETDKQVDGNIENPDQTAVTTNTKEDKSDVKHILFFGNSLTAGYGLDENESFPALIQQRLDSLGLNYVAVNAGLSGETTSGGKNRIDWVLKQKVDVFVLELGANDVLRGLDLKETEANLRAILDKVKASNPDVILVLAGMQAPPNMGNDYTKRFAGIYPKLAKEYQALLIPFLLENVATIPELNLEDGEHPNAKGQYLVRENVWKVLKEVL
ncbi:MAG: arylesterase [Saprospiraceae bacterium]|nr:arylesterase [Saprospiraceae bacterium]